MPTSPDARLPEPPDSAAQSCEPNSASNVAPGCREHHNWPLGMPPGAEAGDDLPLEAAIFCHIFVLNSVLERTGNRIAEAHNLTLPQWMALGCIGHAGAEGLTHSELGQRLMLSKAPITGVVDRLERAALVTRTTSTSDRRVSRIRITPDGLTVWREVRDRLRAQSMEHCECLGAGGREELLGLLGRLLEQVAASDPMLAAMRAPGARRQAQEAQAQVLEAQHAANGASGASGAADEHADQEA